MLRCGLARLRRRLRLAWQEHGDAGKDGENGEGNWEGFENNHGRSPGKYCDVAVQYMRDRVISELSFHDAVDAFRE
jgi:hypothetical protein